MYFLLDFIKEDRRKQKDKTEQATFFFLKITQHSIKNK